MKHPVKAKGCWSTGWECGRKAKAKNTAAPRRAVDHWLAGSIPGWTAVEENAALYQSRYLSNEGRVFFNSPDPLVGADKNGKEDVYEFEPEGLGSCASPGCVALLSSGESDHETAFLDASETGDDVFLLTNQPLTSDTTTSFDIYDARVCSKASPCMTPPAGPPRPCEALQTCRPATAVVECSPAPRAPRRYGRDNQPAASAAFDKPT